MHARRRAVIGALLLVAPLVLLTLQGLAIAPWWWTDRPLTDLRADTGKRFASPLATMWMSRYQVAETPAIILENGVPLACGNMPPEAIAEFGAGRYNLADGYAYFAASDDTDPRTNGRSYTLRWPAPPPILPVNAWVVVATLLAAVGVLILAWTFRVTVWNTLGAPSFMLCAGIFLTVFAMQRAWYFLDVPLPNIEPDTMTYYEPAKALMNGSWPHFEVRPPGFPALLALVLSVTHSLVAVTAAQTLLAAAAALTLIYGVYRLCRPAALWVAIAMAGAATSFWPLHHDTSILSESLYASAIVFSFGFLSCALATGSRAIYAASSASMALVLCARPAGLFLVVIYVLVTAYVWWTRTRPQTAAFAVPFPLILAVLATYNFFVASSFTTTAWAEANLAVATFTFWEKSDGYPDDVNAHIERAVAFVGLSDDERRRRDDTWSPSVLAPIFLKGFNINALNEVMAMRGGYGSARPWLRRIGLDSIRAHPKIYAKFVASMAYMYFIGNLSWRAEFADYVKGRALMLLTDEGRRELRRDPERFEVVLRYFDPSRPVGVTIGDACARGGVGTIEPTPARRVHRLAQRARDLVFAHSAWVAVFALALLLAMARLASSAGHHDVAFVMVMLGLSVIGSGIIVCLVEYAGHRYSYPTEFAVFVVPALAPWLTRRR